MAVKHPDKLNPEMVERLKTLGITEEDFFNSSSDLYIGCKGGAAQAAAILKGQSRAIYDTFIPEKESDMGKYPIAVEVAFGYMDGAFYERYGNRK